jgi:hypothetical protein
LKKHLYLYSYVLSYLVVFSLLCVHIRAFAQATPSQSRLVTLTAHSDSVAKISQAEKLYLQTDKPDYVTGDTLWFKAYIFNAPTFLLSAQSGILHIDIAADSNRVVKQYIFAVGSGLGWGDIPLNEKDYKAGDYTLRAYTNWMRNFSEDVFFYQHFRVAGIGENNWLINSKISVNTTAHVRAQLQLTDVNKNPVADSLLQLKIIAGKKTLYKQVLKTDNTGLLDVNFLLPDKAVNPQIQIENPGKTHKAFVPVTTGATGNIDLQFMPESGSLIAGLNTKVAFKGVGEDGREKDVTGMIVDKTGKQVASFASTHNGMGSFEMLPKDGETYTARITQSPGLTKDYALPVVTSSGTSLHLENPMDSDSIEVAISATGDLARSGNQYFLIAKARGVVCYAAAFNFEKGTIIRHRISKNLFPSGITHFILTKSEGQPLNERLVFIDHHDGLHIEIEPGQETYAPKDSIALHLKITNTLGQPVSGNFSMAVTDNAQVKADTSNNILTRMLLTSDLKGYVENANWYFKNDTSNWEALDNLLLTQGWVSYEPVNTAMPFAAEKEYTISGKVKNVLGAALKKSPVVLLSKSPAIVMDTVTDNQGRFLFNKFPRVDTAIFILQARTRHGKSFNVNIDMDEFVPPVFAAPKTPLLIPWYVNADTTWLTRFKNTIQMRQQEFNPGGGKMLKEVKIVAKKTVKGSQNLNGSGNADIVVDEKELEAAGKKTWLQLCEEKIPGFYGVIVLDKNYSPVWVYRVNYKNVVLVVNGVMLSRVLPPGYRIKDFLNVHNAEDIKGIEVNASPKYVGNYMRRFYPSDIIDPDMLAFVEITTRSGDFKMEFTPGTYLCKPLALSWPRQFYKPKYKLNDTSRMADLRSTIDWEPNIHTDTQGEATVTFYAGTEPRTYTIIAEGTDMNGNIGTVRRKLTIVKREASAKSK